MENKKLLYLAIIGFILLIFVVALSWLISQANQKSGRIDPSALEQPKDNFESQSEELLMMQKEVLKNQQQEGEQLSLEKEQPQPDQSLKIQKEIIERQQQEEFQFSPEEKKAVADKSIEMQRQVMESLKNK